MGNMKSRNNYTTNNQDLALIKTSFHYLYKLRLENYDPSMI